MDIVFNKITQFKDLCSLCKNDKTEPQLVQLAYIIFNKSRIFTDALKEWNKTRPTEKTYSNMKLHMRQQYQELKQVGAVTIEESSLHQVNLMNELTAKHEELVKTIKQDLNDQIKTNMYETMLMMQQMEATPPNLVATDTDSNTSDSINSLTSASTITSLLTSIKSLQEEIKDLKAAAPPKPAPIDKTINPRTGKKWKRYCWSCGCCPHSGKYCQNKLPGHKDEATFNNRMGGSNKFCRPIQE